MLTFLVTNHVTTAATTASSKRITTGDNTQSPNIFSAFRQFSTTIGAYRSSSFNRSTTNTIITPTIEQTHLTKKRISKLTLNYGLGITSHRIASHPNISLPTRKFDSTQFNDNSTFTTLQKGLINLLIGFVYQLH